MGHNDNESARVSYHPSLGFHKRVKTMKEYDPTKQERIAIERDVRQLDAAALAERIPECHDCAQALTEGTEITVRATQAADEADFELEEVKCRHHDIEQDNKFKNSLRELVVEGRVGRCSDQSRQTSWPVLLHPQVRLISPATTAKGYRLPGESGFRTAIDTSEPIDVYRELCWRTDHPPRSIVEQESNTPTAIQQSGTYNGGGI